MENTAKNISTPSSTSTTPTALQPSAPQQHDWVFDVAESARKAETSLQNFISENPVKAVAIAVGLGFAMNLVMKNISSKQEQV